MASPYRTYSSTSHNSDEEIIDRLRRLETRLCKLMLHMGLEPSGELTPTVESKPKDQPKEQPKDYPPRGFLSIFG